MNQKQDVYPAFFVCIIELFFGMDIMHYTFIIANYMYA